MNDDSKDGSLSSLPKPSTISETYHATCHCGSVRYEVTLSPPLAEQKVVSCNCSICSRHGYLLVYPQREQLIIKSGEDALKSYSFGRHRNQHKFCVNCGCSIFFDPRMMEFGDGPPDLLGVNVRMFKGVKFDELELMKYDGWNKWPFLGDDTARLQ